MHYHYLNDCSNIFKFHNVGQGLFYTGQIGSFNFVYDCGSRSKKAIRESVDQYRKKLLLLQRPVQKPLIDLIVISHFDNDHVSGLDRLLELTTVNLVVIPYISPVERILLSLFSYRPEKWYFDFIIDPIHFLYAKGVKKIILITSGDKQKEDRDMHNDKQPDKDNLIIELEDVPKWQLERIIEEENVQTRNKWQEYIRNKKLAVKTHHGKIILPSRNTHENILGIYFLC